MQRQRLLARYHQSQLTQREFAQRHGISHSALVKWLHQERIPDQPSVNFQEVVLPDTAVGWALDVVSRQGWTVRLQQADELESMDNELQKPC